MGRLPVEVLLLLHRARHVSPRLGPVQLAGEMQDVQEMQEVQRKLGAEVQRRTYSL